MRSAGYIILLLLFALFFSCEKDDLEIQNHSGKLKRSIRYMSIEDTIPRVLQNHSYDSNWRLIRIQDNYSTQLLEYDQNEQLIRKYTYRTDESGTVLNDTTFYSYKNGKLASVESVNVNDFWSHKFVYEYENEKLIRKKEYIDQHLQELTRFEYSGDFCTKG